MKKRKAKRTFDMSFAVRIWVSVETTADNYDEALAHARTLEIGDLVEIEGTHNDSYVELIGITDMTAFDTVGGQ